MRWNRFLQYLATFETGTQKILVALVAGARKLASLGFVNLQPITSSHSRDAQIKMQTPALLNILPLAHLIILPLPSTYSY